MNEKTKNTILSTINRHKDLVEKLISENTQTIADAAQLITDSLNKSGTVYLCGNGGSAADAQHIAGEFLGRFKRERSAIPAVALSTDTSVITCIANDYDYQSIFSRQLQGLAKPNDLLWAISTSGNSENVVKAAQLVKSKNAFVLAFTGKPDSKLQQIADVCLCADTPDTASCQEIHQLAYHIICDLVEENFADK